MRNWSYNSKKTLHFSFFKISLFKPLYFFQNLIFNKEILDKVCSKCCERGILKYKSSKNFKRENKVFFFPIILLFIEVCTVSLRAKRSSRPQRGFIAVVSPRGPLGLLPNHPLGFILSPVIAELGPAHHFHLLWFFRKAIVCFNCPFLFFWTNRLPQFQSAAKKNSSSEYGSTFAACRGKGKP